MSDIRTIGIVLIVLGAVAFSYEGYITYRTNEPVIDAGPVHVTAEKTHAIHVPPVLGSLAFIGGLTLLIMSVKKA
jgi:hypothetical protein